MQKSLVLAADVTMITTEGAPKGLIFNEKKCETITLEGQTIKPVLQQFIHLTPAKSMLLGCPLPPLSKGQAMDNSLSSSSNDLEKATSRLGLINVNDALALLRASFSAPKLQHIMRAFPCYDNEHWLKIDELFLKYATSRYPMIKFACKVCMAAWGFVVCLHLHYLLS